MKKITESHRIKVLKKLISEVQREDSQNQTAFKSLLTMSKSIKFDDLDKQRQFDDLILQMTRLIKS